MLGSKGLAITAAVALAGFLLIEYVRRSVGVNLVAEQHDVVNTILYLFRHRSEYPIAARARTETRDERQEPARNYAIAGRRGVEKTSKPRRTTCRLTPSFLNSSTRIGFLSDLLSGAGR
jgi:hypothetical protein